MKEQILATKKNDRQEGVMINAKEIDVAKRRERDKNVQNEQKVRKKQMMKGLESGKEEEEK